MQDHKETNNITDNTDNISKIDFLEDITALKEILINDSHSIKIRMNALFRLRTIASFDAIKALEEALIKEKSSDLIRHEVCYCFGQMIESDHNREEIENFLYKEVFENPKKYNSIVLHEAAEALGNISSDHNLKLLQKFLNYEDDIIKETCEISVENLEWMKNTASGKSEGLDKLDLVYHTNDPAPPFNFKNENKFSTIEDIKRIMHDENESLFNRYRAIFTLREFNNEAAVDALCECFDKRYKNKFSPLFKHEVSFILGQMCNMAKNALTALETVLQDEEEDPIVRHETALALGEITKSKDLLTKYTGHENQLIRESCEIALDFVDYWEGCAC
jgi:deoxyhypusine monooxygenase